MLTNYLRTANLHIKRSKQLQYLLSLRDTEGGVVLRSGGSGKERESGHDVSSLFARIVSREQELEAAVVESRTRAEELIDDARSRRTRISSTVRESTEKEAEELLLQAGREAREEAARLIRRGEEEAERVLREGRERLPAVIGDLLDILLPARDEGEKP
jgi:vacuolar-type H+-ATPase subunit H